MPVSGRARGLPKNQTPVMYVGPDEPPKPSSESALWLDTRSAAIPVASELVTAKASLVQSATVTSPSPNVWFTLPLPVVDWDTDKMYGSPDSITVHYSGLYSLEFCARYSGGTLSGYSTTDSVRVYKNGSTSSIVAQGNLASDDSKRVDVWLDAGDVLRIAVQYTSGSNVTWPHGSYPTFIKIIGYTVQQTSTVKGQEPAGCQAYSSGTQTLSTSATTALTLDQEDWDTDAYHSNSVNNTRMTVPAGRSGFYRISGFLMWAASAAGVRALSIRKNGVTILKTANHYGSASEVLRFGVEVEAYLSSGDFIELTGYQSSGGDLVVGSTTREWAATLTLTAISTYPYITTTAPMRSIGAQVRRTTAQSIPSGTATMLSWSIANTDTDGFWSSALPTRMTIPANCPSGIYQLSGQTYWNETGGTADRQARWYKNGVTISPNAVGAGSVPKGMGNSLAVWGSPGDYFELMAWQSTGSPVDIGAAAEWAQCVASIVYVGSGSAAGTAVAGTEVSRSTAQTYTTTQTAAVTFDTETIDQEDLWAVSPNPTRLTVKQTGWYAYEGSGSFAAPTTVSRPMRMYLRKGGSTTVGNTDHAAGLATYTTELGVSGQVYLSAGEYVELIAYNGDSASKDLSSAFLRLVRMAAGAQSTYVAPTITDAPGAAAHATAAQTITTGASWTALTVGTVDYDSNGFCSTNTRFTIPAGHAGKYHVHGHSRADTTTGGVERNLAIRLGGTTNIARAKQAPSTIGVLLSVDWTGQLNVGDYVELVASHDKGSDASYGLTGSGENTYMSISRLATGPQGDTGPKGDAFYEQGSSFPVSPTSGQAFYRTDIRGGMLFRWNGTYWLSDQLFDLELTGPLMSASNFFGGANVAEAGQTVPRDMDVYVVSVLVRAMVNTTNDGSNYWGIAFKEGQVNNSWLTGTSWTSAGLAPGKWWAIGQSLTFNTLYDTTGSDDTNIHGFTGYASKVGSPGDVYPTILAHYRLRAV
jgi:hypothetical protein